MPAFAPVERPLLLDAAMGVDIIVGVNAVGSPMSDDSVPVPVLVGAALVVIVLVAFGSVPSESQPSQDRHLVLLRSMLYCYCQSSMSPRRRRA